MQVGLEDPEGIVGGGVGGGFRWAALLGAGLPGSLEMLISCGLYRTGEEFLGLVCVCLY